MWANLLPVSGKVPMPVSVCLVILLVWHGWHVRAHVLTAVLKPFQMNRSAINFAVVLAEGCDKLCTR